MKRLRGVWRPVAVIGWVFMFFAVPGQASEPGFSQQGNVFVALDIVQFPSGGAVDTTPLGLSFGGTLYFSDVVAASGAVGFGIAEDEGFGGDPDVGLDPYLRVNLMVGNFSSPRGTFYGLVGLEPYTLTFDGESANESVGEIALGVGGRIGNGRTGYGGVGAELTFVQDADLDDDIVRWSVVLDF